MDDIDFGVDSIIKGKLIIRDLEVLLNSIGIRLNSGKTQIMSSEEAERHFCVSENVRANLLKNQIDQYDTFSPLIKSEIIINLDRVFYELLNTERCGQWLKIIARYTNIYAKINIARPHLLSYMFLCDYPSLRSTIFRYHRSLGYSKRRMRSIFMFIFSGYCLDDSSFSEAVDVIIGWNVNKNDKYISRILRYFSYLPKSKFADHHRLSCGIRFNAKYSDGAELAAYVNSFSDIWPESEWLSRQVASISYLVDSYNRRRIRYLIASSGKKEGMRVLHTLDRISESSAIYKHDKGILQSSKFTILKLALVAAYIESGLTAKAKNDMIDNLKKQHAKDATIKHRLRSLRRRY